MIIGQYTRKGNGNKEAEEIDIDIGNTIIHPEYNYDFGGFDIMIVKLQEKSTHPYAKISQHHISQDGQDLSVIGFGDTNESDKVTSISMHLREVTLDYVTQEDCKEKRPRPGYCCENQGATDLVEQQKGDAHHFQQRIVQGEQAKIPESKSKRHSRRE